MRHPDNGKDVPRVNYRIKMSGEQVHALAKWAARGDGFADVMLDDADDDRIVVGQGDERATFNTDGVECCERCGALAGEELQGDCCYSCGLGCPDDPEASTAAAIESTQFMPDPEGGPEPLAVREAATWDDAEGSECQHCGGNIPADREHCPDCGKRSELLNAMDRMRQKQRVAAQDDPRGERDR